MDINVINNAITTLENEETTFDNVSELAMLYIVRDKMQNELMTGMSHSSNEILPTYKKYREIKTRYQLGQTDEGEVIRTTKLLCHEISEFLDNLFSCTDMLKERVLIIEETRKIYEKISK